MKAHIARPNADADRPGEIVGFFFAEDRRQLYDLIDVCCDVEGCELTELGPGGIYWSDAVDYVVPMEPSDTAPGLPEGATSTEEWLSALFHKKRSGNGSLRQTWLLPTKLEGACTSGSFPLTPTLLGDECPPVLIWGPQSRPCELMDALG